MPSSCTAESAASPRDVATGTRCRSSSPPVSVDVDETSRDVSPGDRAPYIRARSRSTESSMLMTSVADSAADVCWRTRHRSAEACGARGSGTMPPVAQRLGHLSAASEGAQRFEALLAGAGGHRRLPLTGDPLAPLLDSTCARSVISAWVGLSTATRRPGGAARGGRRPHGGCRTAPAMSWSVRASATSGRDHEVGRLSRQVQLVAPVGRQLTVAMSIIGRPRQRALQIDRQVGLSVRCDRRARVTWRSVGRRFHLTPPFGTLNPTDASKRSSAANANVSSPRGVGRTRRRSGHGGGRDQGGRLCRRAAP